MDRRAWWQSTQLAAALLGLGLALTIAGPWLLPGYLFGTDWPGPRRFGVPTDFSSGILFRVVLVVVSAIVSAEVTTKLLIVVAVAAAALGASRALPVGGFIPRAIASLIYVLNPFVYGRIHYGQLLLVAGYALLPWIAAQILDFMREPGWRPALILAAELTALGILDLHLLIPAGLLLIGAAVGFGISRQRDREYLTDLGTNLALALGATVAASSYWLIPLLTGSNSEGHAIATVGTADLAAYSSAPDPDYGLIPNLLGLYGFWAEDTGRFTSMKAFAPLWPAILLIMIALGALGANGVIRRRPEVDIRGGRAWVFALLGAVSIALILEAGVASPVTEPIVRVLDTLFPPYRGMRDAGKWGALVALIYAQLIPLGAIVLLASLRKHVNPRRTDVAEALATGLLLALPLYYGNGLLFGIHGQVQPSAYPSGWYQADQMLVADPHPGRTLFLPWHLYLGLDFVRNENNIVASPAPSFFSVPVLISDDPEIPGIPPPNDTDQAVVSNLVALGPAGDWARELARRNIKYVLVAREVDWRRYGFLANQPGFTLVADFGSISIYRNLSW
jgi:hypothetical protein